MSAATTGLAILMAGAVLLAGCSGATPAAARSKSGGAEYVGKVLHGVVLDDESYPLEGADVRVEDLDLNMTTGPDGAFRFTGLDPIDYLVIARRDGHQSQAARAAMVMGREFHLNFTLPRLPTGEPHNATQVLNAHISCAAAVKLDYPGWIDQDCGAADPNNKPSGVFTFEPHSSGFVVEFDWQPAQTCSQGLRALMVLRDPNGMPLPIVEESILPGERITIPPSQFTHRSRTGGEIVATLLADRCDNDYAGVAVQQSVEVHFTAFYFQDVPEGFSALSS